MKENIQDGMRAKQLIPEKEKKAQNGGKFRKKKLNSQKWKIHKRTLLQTEAHIAHRWSILK